MDDRDGELLSAYLTGDLSDADARALEARLARDETLAARLEATRTVIEGLRGFDAVEPPAGFSERLRERLASEGGSEAPASLADAREARAERARRMWPTLGAVAASVAGIALVAGVAIVGFGAGDEDAVGVFAELDAASERGRPTGGDDAQLFGADEADGEAFAFTEPVVFDGETPLEDEDAAQEHVRGVASETLAATEAAPAERAEAATSGRDLLGLDVDLASDLASSFAVAIQREGAFASGHEPGACLDVVTASTEQPVVVTRVESVVFEGARGVAFVSVTARAGSETLDRLEAWILEADGCTPRLYLDLTE